MIPIDTMLKDPTLAPQGRRKVDFAASRMPVLAAVAAELARTRPLEGMRIAACLHVTTETANLCRALHAGGAELALCASNSLSTKGDVAAAIHDELGAAVFAVHGADRETFYRQVDAALATVMDLTFATQALAVQHLATAGVTLGPGVHPVPAGIEERVARHKLAALGVGCDDLTAEQESYLRDWRIGS